MEATLLFCTCTVRVAGNPLHTVTNKLASVPEIRVLKHLHGEDAVLDIRPVYHYDPTSTDPRGRPDVHAPDLDPVGPWSDEAERQRLSQEYEGAGGAMDETAGLVAKLFGPFAELPKRLAQIGIDPRIEARRLRAEAEKQAKLLEQLAAEQAAFDDEDEVKAFDAEFDTDENEGTVEAAAPAQAKEPKRRGRPRKTDTASEGSKLADAFV